MKAATLCILIFSILTCKNTQDAMSSEKQNTESISGNYIIDSVRGEKNSYDFLRITFDNKSKSVYGYSGCNRFTGSYEITKNTIKIGPLASTRMMCEPKRNAIESKILEILAEVNSFYIQDGVLNLLKDNSTLLVVSKTYSDMVVTYEASTRGYFEIIQVSEDHVMTSNDRNLDVKQTANMPLKKWNELQSNIDRIDLNSLSTLEAPSLGHQTDRSAMATLKISAGGKTYQTPVFDNGNPPKSIENIVNMVISMKKMTEKQ